MYISHGFLSETLLKRVKIHPVYRYCYCLISKLCPTLCSLCPIPWTVDHQVPLSIGSSQQEYWSGLPCPPQNTECGSFTVSLVAQMVKNLPAIKDTQVQFLGWKDPGIGNGNPLQYSCWENSMDRRAWRATVHGVIKSQTLSD